MIYFIRSGKYVKIGYSKNPKKRLDELQTGNPEKLKLIAVMQGNLQTEKSLHDLYSNKRIRGEWFRYIGDLKASIMSINNQESPEVTDIRSFQRAGEHLRIRQARNKKLKRGDSNLAERIERHLQS